jgi:ribosomal protein S18 acetylase RimI-like enzyme
MSAVINTDQSDVARVFTFFDASIRYQEQKGFPVWKNYDKGAILRDIENKNQYKVIIDSEPAIIFSVCYEDKVIWRAMDQGNSIYLHRIVVNPDFKGQKLFGEIMKWAIAHAKGKRLDTIRMDTWASNAVIVEYYKSFGFRVVENFTTPDTTALPVHNRNLALTLLEFKVV